MKSDIKFFMELVVSFLPFILFAFLNSKANVKKVNRSRQYAMPVIAVVYSVVLLVFLNKATALCMEKFLECADFFEKLELTSIADYIRDIHATWGVYLELVLFNTAALLLYVIVKRILTAILGKMAIRRNTLIGSVVELFYSYDEQDDCWYIKEHYGQACTFVKTAYYGSCFASALALSTIVK